MIRYGEIHVLFVIFFKMVKKVFNENTISLNNFLPKKGK